MTDQHHQSSINHQVSGKSLDHRFPVGSLRCQCYVEVSTPWHLIVGHGEGLALEPIVEANRPPSSMARVRTLDQLLEIEFLVNAINRLVEVVFIIVNAPLNQLIG